MWDFTNRSRRVNRNVMPFLIPRDSQVILFSSSVFACLFVCLSRSLSGRFSYDGLVSHKQYFADLLSNCVSYVSLTHGTYDDVPKSKSRRNLEIAITLSVFIVEHGNNYCRNLWLTGYLPFVFESKPFLGIFRNLYSVHDSLNLTDIKNCKLRKTKPHEYDYVISNVTARPSIFMFRRGWLR